MHKRFLTIAAALTAAVLVAGSAQARDIPNLNVTEQRLEDGTAGVGGAIRLGADGKVVQFFVMKDGSKFDFGGGKPSILNRVSEAPGIVAAAVVGVPSYGGPGGSIQFYRVNVQVPGQKEPTITVRCRMNDAEPDCQVNPLK